MYVNSITGSERGNDTCGVQVRAFGRMAVSIASVTEVMHTSVHLLCVAGRIAPLKSIQCGTRNPVEKSSDVATLCYVMALLVWCGIKPTSVIDLPTGYRSSLA